MPRQKSQHVDNPKAVGDRLKAAREAAGLSQRKLAFSGCSPAYVSRIEAGDRIPSLQLLRELGKRLDVTEDWLATGAPDVKERESKLIDAELALRLGEATEARRLYEELGADESDAVLRAAAAEGLGQLAFRAGDFKEAIRRFEEALTVSGEQECDRPGLAESLGRSYAGLGELAPAISIFEQCLRACERSEDRIQTVRFACLLGYALIDNGDLSRAEQVLARALTEGKDVADPVSRARLYFSQSRLLAERGDHESGVRYGRMALTTLESTEDLHFRALAHQLLAHLEIDGDRVESALEHLREGWPLLEASGSPVELAHFRLEEARALARIGRKEEAASLAMRISHELGDAMPEDAGRTYALLADVYLELGDPERAQELYELAVEYLKPGNPSRYVADVYAKLASLHESEGRRDRAYDYMKLALGMQQQVATRVHA